MKKVLILGGGFAGVKAAIKLQKQKKFDVTLISNRDYLFLYPVSIWLPVEKITEKDVKIPLDKIAKKHGFKVIIDAVSQIKATDNSVIGEKNVYQYDYLVVAFGADKMKPAGVENTSTICGVPDQTFEFAEQFKRLVAKGSGKIAIGFGGNPKDKSGVRGGPAFELMFNIDHYLRKKKLRKNFELYMFAPMAEPGARMGRNALKTTNSMLDSKGVKSFFGNKITAFEPNAVVFENETKLNADLIMFIAAGTGSAVLKKSDLPLSDAGFVKVNNYNQVENFPSVYAIGDAAAMEGPEWIAKQGHIAEAMGGNVAFNIGQIENKKGILKSYKENLSILCIMDTGNGAAFVFRNDKRQIMIPMPIVGHWLKKAWGVYARFTKLYSI